MITSKFLTIKGMFVGLLSLTLLMGLSTQAASSSKTAKKANTKEKMIDSKKYANLFPDVPNVKILSYNPKLDGSESNKSGKKVRSLSSADSMPTDYIEIKNKLLALKSGPDYKDLDRRKATEELDSIILSLETSFSNPDSGMSAELKLLAAILIPLRTLRGQAWKLSQILDKHIMQKDMLFTMLRNTYQNALATNEELLPVVLDYLLFPYEKMDNIFKQAMANFINLFNFDKAPEIIKFQLFLGSQVYPALNLMKNRIIQIDVNQPIQIDLAFFNQIKGFPNVIAFGEKEKKLLVASIDLTLARLSIMLAYDFSNFPNYMDWQLAEMGFNSANPIKTVKGMSLKDINETIKRYNIFSYSEFGSNWLKTAFIHFYLAYDIGKDSAVKYENAYSTLIDEANSAIGINFKNILTDMDKDLAKALTVGISGLENIINKSKSLEGVSSDEIRKTNWVLSATSSTPILNRMNGDLLYVNLPLLFKNRPTSSDFFPTSYNNAELNISIFSNITFNPYNGLPNDWDMAKIHVYFPGAKVKDIPFIKSTLMSLGFPFASNIQ